jgi:hypothetical protein
MSTKLTQAEIDKELQKSEINKLLKDKSLPEKMRKDLESKKQILINETIVNK